MDRWVHVEADDILDPLGKGGIVGASEGAPAMRLQAMGFPDAPHVLQRPAAIADNRFQSRPVLVSSDHTDILGHAHRLAYQTRAVNGAVSNDVGIAGGAVSRGLRLTG